MAFRSHSLPPPTDEDRARWALIRVCGCIACGRPWPEIHHLTVGGKHGAPRLGHRFTIGLCRWCHRGYPPRGPGPSYASQPRLFRETYGDDQTLLDKQDDMIGFEHAVIPDKEGLGASPA